MHVEALIAENVVLEVGIHTTTHKVIAKKLWELGEVQSGNMAIF